MRLLRWIFLAQLAMVTAAPAQQDAVPTLPPIVEPASGERLPGKFVWADLFSSDIEASRKFYEKVFGWEWRLIKQPPKPYGIFYFDELPVAGLAYREAPDGSDAYGRWIHYISVEDVNATEDAVSKRGGHVLLNTRTFADRGDFAILRDIHDAPFGIIHSSSGDPGDYRAAFGEWIWHALFTRDLEEAIGFYTELFDYESENDNRHPEIMNYLLKSNGYLRAGIGALPADSSYAPTWLGYLRVANIDAVIGLVQANGGKVLLEPQATIANGNVAIVADPTGATIGLLRWDYADIEQQEMRP